jgi:hypothetical protein
MRSEKVLIAAAALLLTAGVAIAGQTSSTNSAKQTTPSSTQTKVNPAIHHRMGTVASLTANELVLDHTWKGKEEKTTFTLDSSTKKEGNIEQGEHVVVYYHVENGQRIATELKASESKASSEAKKS